MMIQIQKKEKHQNPSLSPPTPAARVVYRISPNPYRRARPAPPAPARARAPAARAPCARGRARGRLATVSYTHLTLPTKA